MVKEMLEKYKHLVMYAVFGVLTTVINLACYYFSYQICGISNVLSTGIAWLFAVAFAFVTNKRWVFDSKSFDIRTLLYEIPAFIGARVATGLLDVLIMYVSVDCLGYNATLWKLISNIIVIVINYVASKLFIFKNR